MRLQHVALLEDALARAVPASRTWSRHSSNERWSVEIASADCADGRRLEIELRPDGDVDVRFHVGRTGIGRAPYEAQWPVLEGRESETCVNIADFVAALLDEQIVLVYRRGVFRGGRDFVSVNEIATDSEGFEWVASWRATYDRSLPW